MSNLPIRLPEFLINRVHEGRVILFLGAGASYGAQNRLQKNPPLGWELRNILAYKIGENPEEETNLAVTAAAAEERLGTTEYYRLLQQHYKGCKPSDAQRTLARLFWPRIYTTNIDDSLEAAYRSEDRPYEVFLHRDPIEREQSETQIVKLNGSVDRLKEGIIFNPDDYASAQVGTPLWYRECAADYFQYTFLFVGTELDEPIFWANISRLARTGQSPGMAYIVTPKASSLKKDFLAKHKITHIPGSLEDLSKTLMNEIGATLTAAQVFVARNPTLEAVLSDNELRKEIETFSHEVNEITVVDKDVLSRTRNTEIQPKRRDFYYGAEPLWEDILDGVPARLSFLDEIIAAVQDGQQSVLVEGPAGSGKTTMLMMAALEIATIRRDVLCLFVQGTKPLPSNVIRAVHRANRSYTILFINDFSFSARDIADLLEERRGDRRFQVVTCERTHKAASGQLLRFNTKVHVSKIRRKDIVPILNKLQVFGRWDRLEEMSEGDRIHAIEEKAEKQLLVGLREATWGHHYDETIASEYREIADEEAKSLATLVAVAFMHRIPLTASTARRAYLEFSGYDWSRASLNQGAEDIVYVDREYIRFRHSTIAHYLVTRVVSRETVIRAIRAIVISLSRHKDPHKKKLTGSEGRLFAALLHHDFLLAMFRDKPSGVIQMLNELEHVHANDALFMLQFALFEEGLGGPYLEKAINHIRTAHDLWPESYEILNAYANIHYKAAKIAPNVERSLEIMEEASSLLKEQMKDPRTEPHAVVNYCRGRFSVLSKWLPEKAINEWHDQYKRMLTEARIKFAGNSEIQETSRYLAGEVVVLSNRYRRQLPIRLAPGDSTSGTEIVPDAKAKKKRRRKRRKKET